MTKESAKHNFSGLVAANRSKVYGIVKDQDAYKTVTVGTDISDSDIDTQIAEAYDIQHFCVNNED